MTTFSLFGVSFPCESTRPVQHNNVHEMFGSSLNHSSPFQHDCHKHVSFTSAEVQHVTHERAADSASRHTGVVHVPHRKRDVRMFKKNFCTWRL